MKYALLIGVAYAAKGTAVGTKCTTNKDCDMEAVDDLK